MTLNEEHSQQIIDPLISQNNDLKAFEQNAKSCNSTFQSDLMLSGSKQTHLTPFCSKMDNLEELKKQLMTELRMEFAEEISGIRAMHASYRASINKVIERVQQIKEQNQLAHKEMMEQKAKRKKLANQNAITQKLNQKIPQVNNSLGNSSERSQAGICDKIKKLFGFDSPKLSKFIIQSKNESIQLKQKSVLKEQEQQQQTTPLIDDSERKNK